MINQEKMDNYNFTKGKWNYRESYDEKYSQPTCIIGTEVLSEFITIWSGLDLYDEINIETKANALLISKSPILLQAIYDSIEPLKKAGLKEMADYHEKIYLESVNL